MTRDASLEPYSPEYGRTWAMDKRDGGVQMVEPEIPGGAAKDDAGVTYVVYLVEELVSDLAPDGKAGAWEKQVGAVNTPRGPDAAIEEMASQFDPGSRFRAIAKRNLGPIRTSVVQTKLGLE